ncbi:MULTISPECIES: Asp-tRNA(Asn)/Glu-tRNA(Gln) amidotransferase subunit GatB [Streptomyces]|uniref:Asp-tRNA(Asn)/Glu-tRNA(Gln) amidotransferase subunit GatB n=1 Tax=Streptomyces TaxID=1883 RepID=UPI0004C92595|nr:MULTISPECIES: Asp-tRNA(Asn)/Glu-tRNA(Gln) amidotransferase subunit GatB [Streptomyces]MDX3605125.1 Asp-tRNA(Asn)/Glu-tRNA(Gln) amidotransferase subunit GatB [Streptomyces sp. FL06-04B]MDX3736819.1 Asp-tRNA(Asn)/Glu-tRNA(Gln) amidotransferase subunit GatB [Streptomyces sp. ID01-15D]
MTVTDLVSYEDALASYDPVMGLEVHVELGTKTKMFCGCSTELKQGANSQTCPVCLGLPGALPVVNEIGVESAIKIGLALHCEIAEWCRFARKNYFYPDMPKNFQTSQYDEPIAFNGYLDVQLEDGEIFRVEIERAHMEEDTGKSTHVGGATGRIHGASHSLLDYNRAGIPLIEIVTKPIEGAGARAPEVAKAYVAELRELIRALGVSEARMEMGQMRCDVNLSLRPNGTTTFGTRSETKNVNSLRSVERAARFEIQRHAAVLSSGGTIVQETRHFHEEDGSTTAGRIKDNAEDYRYFPEPDLVPVAPARDWVEELRKGLPELPRLRRARLKEEWGVSEHDMQSILNAGAVDLIVATIEAGAPADQARKWWMGELARNANETGRGLDELPITPEQVARVAELVARGDLNDKLARQVIEGVLAGEGDPDTVVEKRGLKVVSDEGALSTAVDEAIAGNAAIADKIRGGKVAAAGALVGAVMKATRGQADAARVRELILEKLGVEG